MSKGRILCIDDEMDLLDTLRKLLSRRGYEVLLANSGEEGLVALEREKPHLVITDLMMPRVGGMEILSRSKERHPNLPVMMITAHATVQTAIEAMRRGAHDFVTKPFTHEQLMVRVERAMAHRRLQDENLRLKEELKSADETGGIVGTSDSMRRIVDLVRRVAPTDLGVLITGESGTGKEVVARAVHRLSRRRNKDFVPVDCAAIPQNLMESELFGHEKGAFTGASASRDGLVECADGGTFFLDEIGELDPGVQVKLLRLLQEGEYRSVGGTRMKTADLRVVAATNRNLEEAVAEGAFREDLFHRLNVVRVDLPPLRERDGDVPLLAEHFIRRLCAADNRDQLGLSSEVMRVLERHDWPGNVRELVNCCRYLVGLAEGPVAGVTDLPPLLREGIEADPGVPAPIPGADRGDVPQIRTDLPYKHAKRLWLEYFEKSYISVLLDLHEGNISQAARAAGIDRKSIQRLMKRNEMSLDD